MDQQRPPVDAFCPACGADVQQQQRNCPRCGVMIQWKVPSPEEAAQQGGPAGGYLYRVGDYYVAPRQWIGPTGWTLLGIALFLSWIPFVNLISALLVLFLAVILTSDVYNLNLGKLRYSTLGGNYFSRQTNFQWALGFFLPVVFWLYMPAYLLQRNQLAQQVRDTIAGNHFMPDDERAAIDRRDLVMNIIGGVLLLGLAALVTWAVISI